MKELEWISDAREDMEPVFQRMKQDEELYLLKPYQMMMLPPYDQTAMPEVANVTLNDPLAFAQKAISVLGNATMQTVVEGEHMTDKQTTTVETFLDDSLYSLDERLVGRGWQALKSWVDEQICLRGRVMARCCIGMDQDGELLLDITPIDATNFVAEYESEDMAWGAAWFKRKKRQIESEFEIEFGGKEGEVIQFFDKDRELVFVDGKLIREQQNPYGYVPYVEAICPAGTSMTSELAAQHKGESIFWPNRNLWQEKNRVASIMQTLNVMSLFGTMQYESTRGEAATKPAESPFGHRKVIPVEKGGGYKPLQVGDIKNSTRMFYAILDAALQRGSLSAVDYGTLQFPLSAVAITKLSAQRDDILLPRVQAQAMFYQALSRMMIDQTKELEATVRVGVVGAQHEYSKNDLDGDYQISYRFYTHTKEQQIADLQIAGHAANFVSRDTIRREILNLQDPDGEEVKFQSEQAEMGDEVLFLYRRAVSLIEDEKYIDAYILAKRIVMALRMRKMQEAAIQQQAEQAQQPEGQRRNGDQQGKAPAEELMPLTGGGGGGRRPAPQLPEEPREDREVQNGEV